MSTVACCCLEVLVGIDDQTDRWHNFRTISDNLATAVRTCSHILYCSADRRCRCGAAIKYLSHSESFASPDTIVSGFTGTKHLALKPCLTAAMLVDGQVKMDGLVCPLRTRMPRTQAAIDADWREYIGVAQLELAGIDKFARMFD